MKFLERGVGQKQLNIFYFEKMPELAKEEFDIDIKKTQTPYILMVRVQQRKSKLQTQCSVEMLVSLSKLSTRV